MVDIVSAPQFADAFIGLYSLHSVGRTMNPLFSFMNAGGMPNSGLC